MNWPRRVELGLGSVCFAALGAAFCWMAAEYWRTGTMRCTPLLGTATGALGAAIAVGYALVGVGTILAAVLFCRARWTPSPPGDPVEAAPDQI